MKIITREQIKKGMTLFVVRVDSSRETNIEKIEVLSDPHKVEYGDGEFFMWAIEGRSSFPGPDSVVMSTVDMGVDQVPQYNFHQAFSTEDEATNYAQEVGIDYAALDDNNIEFGGEIYNIGDNDIDPNEMIPFTFDDCVAALNEMDLDWVMEVSDAAEEILEDLDLYNRLEEDSAYERAMKIVQLYFGNRMCIVEQ